MDELDRRIVMQLQRNGALTNPELGELVGSSAPSCWRRVRQLEDSGVLTATVRLANRKALGQTVNVMCQVRLCNHRPETVSAFERFVADEPHVMECYSMSGEWDYLLLVVAEDVEAYEHFLMGRLVRHPSVGGASSHFALRMVKYQTEVPIAAG